MTNDTWGATRDEWNRLASLVLPDLLPSILDPSEEMSSRSKAQAGNKTPTKFNRHGKGVGIAEWTTRPATTNAELNEWRDDPRLGAGIAARTIHGIDIDIDDSELADKIESAIIAFTDMIYPARTRPNSGRRVLLFRISDNTETIKKKVIKCASGAVEWLFHRQYIVLAGRHQSGERYHWAQGIPSSMEDIPALSLDTLKALFNHIAKMLVPETPADPWGADHVVQVGPRYKEQVKSDDPVVAWLEENGWIKDWNSDGSISVVSPWESEYSAPSGPTTVVYYPSGVGEREQHGFSSLHATDIAKKRNDRVDLFLEACGYEEYAIDAAMPVVEPEVNPEGRVIPPRPQGERIGKSSILKGNLINTVATLRWVHEAQGWSLCYDEFKDQLLIRKGFDQPFKVFKDEDYTDIKLYITRRGLDTMVSKQLVVDAVHTVARDNVIDSARNWLDSLQWDGTDYIGQFASRVLGLEDEYSTAVWRYFFTAAAGRILIPGTKADMTPVLIGAQGLRKSSLIAAIAPAEPSYAAIDLSSRDADLARLLRGVIVAEWDELRGINTREEEAIKGWLTRTKDEWIPKFKEYAVEHQRRFVLIGTTNVRAFHNDPTGARRFLPQFVKQMVDTQWVIEHREQLWAQGRELFNTHGVLWQKAEDLAALARRQATVRDTWIPSVVRWLDANKWPEGFDSSFLLETVLGMDIRHSDAKHIHRVRRVMAFLQYEEDESSKWRFTLA